MSSSSKVEILSISNHGIWIYVLGREYFISYKDFPWFKDAKVSDIYHVQSIHDRHLYWDRLDVDLDINSLENPEAFPLKFC